MSVKNFFTTRTGKKGTQIGALRLAGSLGVIAAITLLYSITRLANTLTVSLS